MRGVLVTEWTEFKNLALAECAAPALGPGQVRVRTQAVGVSFATSVMVAGKYQRKPPLPFTPGSEVAGYVTETAPDVERLKAGDRVAGQIDWGGMAEECVADEIHTFKIPDSLDFNRAICFISSYSTSYAALVWPHLLQVKAGDSILIHGAAGGVGLAAVEIAKVLGATVIATAGTSEKLDAVRAHGADHAINYRTTSFREPVLELTGGEGVNAVYDPVGGDVFMQSLRCIAPEGRIMPVGFASGVIPQIPANILLVKNITVCGLNKGYYVGWSPKDMRREFAPRIAEMMTEIYNWYDDGKLKPRVSHNFPLENFQDAMAAVLERKSLGRVVLVMDEEARRLGL